MSTIIDADADVVVGTEDTMPRLLCGIRSQSRRRNVFLRNTRRWNLLSIYVRAECVIYCTTLDVRVMLQYRMDAAMMWRDETRALGKYRKQIRPSIGEVEKSVLSTRRVRKKTQSYSVGSAAGWKHVFSMVNLTFEWTMLRLHFIREVPKPPLPQREPPNSQCRCWWWSSYRAHDSLDVLHHHHHHHHTATYTAVTPPHYRWCEYNRKTQIFTHTNRVQEWMGFTLWSHRAMSSPHKIAWLSSSRWRRWW